MTKSILYLHNNKNFLNMKTHLFFKQLLLVGFFAITATLWAQTTVTYNFATAGASNGLTETAIDTNVSFASFQNNSTTPPTISSGQLRLYQLTSSSFTKGGSILVIPKNGATITSYVIYASGTTGAGKYSVDGGTGIGITGPTYTISSITAATGVEIYTIATGTANRIYVNKIEVTYTGGTPIAPTVTSTAATLPSTTGATLNGTINANGVSTDASFEYGKTISYGSTITASPSSVTGSTSTAISAAISSLDVNTQYNYRAVGTVSSTVTNGGNSTLWTLANTPSATTVNNPQLTSLDVALNATDGNPATTQYAIQETTGVKYVQADGSLGATEVWQTAATWGTVMVTGLASGTEYMFKAKARNGENVETALGSATSGTTTSISLATSGNTKDQLSVYVSNQIVYVKSADKIATIEVYEMTGKLISNSKNINSQNASLSVNFKGIAIVKLVLENGKVISKKVMIK